VIVFLHQLGWLLPGTIREAHIDLQCPHTAPIYRRDPDRYLGKAKLGR
jgi:hypothetical protein